MTARIRKPRKGSKTTWLGMRAYYRRTLKDGMVKLYLRDRTNCVAGALVVLPEGAKAFKSGKTYTIQQEWL